MELALEETPPIDYFSYALFCDTLTLGVRNSLCYVLPKICHLEEQMYVTASGCWNRHYWPVPKYSIRLLCNSLGQLSVKQMHLI